MTFATVLFAMISAQPAYPALPLPTPRQVEWHDMELTSFVHFAPNTWQDKEYDDLSLSPAQLNPSKLDTDQWAKTVKDGGSKMLIFVAKHVGGFCWWQTKTTDYSVKNSPWRAGKGDVMADLQKSCKKYGLKLGVYLSPADSKHGVEVGGRAKDPAQQDAYNRIFREQLTELLTKYGEIYEVWFDGSLIFDVSDILAKHAPNAIVFQGPQANIRWVGNEEGFVPYPGWNGAKYDPKTWGTLTSADGDPNGDRWLPNEVDCRIRDTWFWNTKNAPALKSVDKLMGMYERSVGHGGVMLLNQTPDPTGLIPAADVKRVKEFAQEIERRYGAPIVSSQGKGKVVIAQPSSPVLADAVSLMEDIRQGERVRKYVVEGLVDGSWQTLAEGTAIGHKKIDKFDPVRVASVRLTVTESVGEPMIRQLAVFRTKR